MTATLTRTALSVNEIATSVSSYAGSLAYMKKIMPIAVINIVHNRVTYEDSYYTKHKIMSVPYKTLRHSLPKKHVLFNLYWWLQDALKGLEEKYLRDLFIQFKDNTSGTIIEEYRFTITYNPNDHGELPTGPKVVEATADFLKQINELSGEEKMIQENVTMIMRVVLNQDAPDNFLPKCFEKEKEFIDQQEKNYDATVGIISTGHHEMKVLAKGQIYQMNEPTPSQREAVLINSHEPNEMTHQDDVINNNASVDKVQAAQNTSEVAKKNTTKRNKENANEENDVQRKSKRGRSSTIKTKQPVKRSKRQIKATSSFDDFQLPKKVSRTRRTSKKLADVKENTADDQEAATSAIINGNEEIQEVEEEVMQVEPKDTTVEAKKETVVKKLNIADIDLESLSKISISSRSSSEPENIEISCMCKINYQFPKIDIIACAICSSYQHTPCVGYKSMAAVPKRYLCLKCQEKDGNIIDLRMHTMKEDSKRVFLALLRLVSVYCWKTKKSPQDIINQIMPSSRLNILYKMIKLKVIIDDEYGYLANIPYMESKILNGSYFYRQEDSQILGNTCTISIEDENDSTKLI